ncbi:MAG: YfiR family protein [Fibrobacterales bacterium]
MSRYFEKSFPIRKIILLVVVLLAFSNVFSQNSGENKLKAAYLIKVVSLVSWSEGDQSEKFIVLILGDSPLSAWIKKGMEGRTIKKRVATVQEYSLSDSIPFAHVIYISPENEDDFDLLIKKNQKHRALIVTENPSLLAKGAHVVLYKDANKIRFNMNTGAMAASGLKASSFLLSYLKKMQGGAK